MVLIRGLYISAATCTSFDVKVVLTAMAGGGFGAGCQQVFRDSRDE